MDWSSLFRRSGAVADPPRQTQEPVDAVQRARTRARQRLIGAVMLLVVGVLGFPLVFETQPRPIPVDIPIDIPKKDGMPPLVMPPVARAADPASAAATDEPVTDAPDRIITETREEAGLPTARPPAPRASASTWASAGLDGTPRSPGVVASAADRSLARSDAKAVSRPEPRVVASGDDAARAKALLEGRPEASSASTSASEASAARYIVQVGAFAESGAAQGTRLKLERLGLKTYTQVANTPEGARIRVRLGPFASRDEADRALAKARAAGLGAVIQVL